MLCTSVEIKHFGPDTYEYMDRYKPGHQAWNVTFLGQLHSVILKSRHIIFLRNMPTHHCM